MNRTSSLFLHLLFGIILTFSLNTCQNSKEISAQQDVLSSAKMVDKAMTIHHRTLVLDSHADIVMPTTSTIYLSDDGLSKTEIGKLEAGGTKAVVMTLAVPPGPRTFEGDVQGRLDMHHQLAAVKTVVRENPDKLIIAKSSSEILAADQSNKIAIILGFQNARALKKDVNSIDFFYQQGVRIFGLNHIGHNDFSDSSRPFFNGETGVYEPAAEHNGLSALGVAAVNRINKLGAILDVSQMSKPATIQAINLSNAPVIASHSNVRAISDVSRNLSDEEIDLIASKGGVICVSPFRAYLLDYSDPVFVEKIKAVRRDAGISEIYSYPFELYWEIKEADQKLAFLQAMSDTLGPAYVKDLVLHIDYIVKRVGIDHVGIGSDFNHGGGINGYFDAADALNVTIALFNKGYSEKDIQKVWSGNFLKLMEKVSSINN